MGDILLFHHLFQGFPCRHVQIVRIHDVGYWLGDQLSLDLEDQVGVDAVMRNISKYQDMWFQLEPTSPDSPPRLPNTGVFPCPGKLEGGRPPLAAGC
jgi:hypothetical protein